MTYETRESAVRILIVDDQALVRKGIRALLSTEHGMEVVGEAKSGREAVNKAQELKPDVILMDLVMPEMDGIEATRQVMTLQPQARVLVLTSYATNNKIFPAIKAGAMGYLLKDSEPDELVQAIRLVSAGESSLHPKIARKLLQEISGSSRSPESKMDPSERQPVGPRVDPLTEREVEVLRMVASGKSNQEIAELLVISPGTVRTHISNVLGKLHLVSRTQATLYALKEGLASLDDIDIYPAEE